MAVHQVRVCDFDEGSCQRNATCYKVWRDGDGQAREVDLCEEHAQPLLAVIERGRAVDLPTKPRVRMERTELRTTERTRPLKK